MSDHRSSMMVIIFVGMISFAVLMILMMVNLQELEQTDAGTRAKLGNAVAEKFKVEKVTVRFADGEGFQILQLSYVTREHASSDGLQDEMRAVTEFVRDEMLQYQDEPILKTRRIAVKRTELYGSGCFQSTYENELTLDVPERKAKRMNPGRFP